MATPAQIQSDLLKGWQYFSMLSADEATKAASGCGCCGNKLWGCLFRILNALQFRVDAGLYDDTTEKLHSDMMEIIGDFVPTTLLTGYFGVNDGSIPDISQIMEGEAVMYVAGNEDIVVPFGDTGSPEYHWFAYQTTEPQLDDWISTTNPFNSGTVGEAGGTFLAWTTVSGYRVTVTRFTTQFPDSIRFY